MSNFISTYIRNQLPINKYSEKDYVFFRCRMYFQTFYCSSLHSYGTILSKINFFFTTQSSTWGGKKYIIRNIFSMRKVPFPLTNAISYFIFYFKIFSMQISEFSSFFILNNLCRTNV